MSDRLLRWHPAGQKVNVPQEPTLPLRTERTVHLSREWGRKKSANQVFNQSPLLGGELQLDGANTERLILRVAKADDLNIKVVAILGPPPPPLSKKHWSPRKLSNEGISRKFVDTAIRTGKPNFPSAHGNCGEEMAFHADVIDHTKSVLVAAKGTNKNGGPKAAVSVTVWCLTRRPPAQAPHPRAACWKCPRRSAGRPPSWTTGPCRGRRRPGP